MTLSEIRRWLKERDIHLTKSLGQNLLHDPHQLDRIVECAALNPADRVLEIGPGLGPLTERLVLRAREVLAVEKDRRLVQVLKERFDAGQASSLSSDSLTRGGDEQAAEPEKPADVSEHQETSSERESSPGATKNLITGGTPVLQIVHDDALEWLKREPGDWSEWKMVSNLPYSVGSPILVELCRGTSSPRLMVVTLQLEVVQRLMAGPGGKDYGVLTLMVQLDFQPTQHFQISRACFFPEPDVDSACLVLRRRESPLLPEELRRVFVRVVKRAFSQRRKMMKNLLRAEWPAQSVEAAMADVGLSLQARAEVVSLEQFVALTRHLASTNGSTIERSRPLS